MSQPGPDGFAPARAPDPARRQAVALAGLLAVALALWGVLAAIGGGGSHSRGANASGPSAAGHATLLDALAPDLQGAGRGAAAGNRLTLPLGPAVAQLFLVGFGGTDPQAPFFARLRRRDWGGVVLDRSNFVNTTQLRALTAQIVKVAAAAGHTPPFIAAQQPGGDQDQLPGLPPAPEPAQGAHGDAATAQRQAIAAARALRSLRVDMNLAPTADLGYQAGAGAGRAFAADPAVVARLSTAAVAGYRRVHVVAVVGHFPGEGAASQDPESGPATVGLSLAELRARDLVPFAAALHSASAIQTSDALFTAIDPVTPAAISPAAVALLRQRLHYGGVIVTGDLTAAASYAGTSVGAAAVAALRAGSDMLYVPGDPANQEAAYTAVLLAVRGGQLPLRTVAVAVARVLALKRGYGLLGR